MGISRVGPSGPLMVCYQVDWMGSFAVEELVAMMGSCLVVGSVWRLAVWKVVE